MGLNIVERLVPGFWFASVPAEAGPFPAVAILHAPADAQAGWAARDATLFAAHGFAALAVHMEDVAGAMAALRAAPFCNGKLGVFTLGAGAERLAPVLAALKPDAVAMHAPAPMDLTPFTAYAGPLFLSHGCDDERCPAETSRRLEIQARQAGHSPEVHFYEGMDHGLNDETMANVNTERFMTFFARHLATD